MTRFNLTDNEVDVATDVQSYDPNENLKNRIAISGTIAAIVMLALAFCAAFGVWNEFAIERTIGLVLATLVTIGLFLFGTGLPNRDLVVRTIRDDAWIARRMERTAETRAEVVPHVESICERLNAEAFRVPPWATIGKWTWTFPHENRLYVGSVVFAVPLTAANDESGAELSRYVEVSCHDQVAWDRVYPSLRSDAIDKLRSALHSVADELGVIEAVPPPKPRW